MSIMTWADERSKAMTMWDIGFLKIYAGVFGMLVGAYFSSFVIRNVWVFVAVVAVLGGRGVYRWFTAPPPSGVTTR